MLNVAATESNCGTRSIGHFISFCFVLSICVARLPAVFGLHGCDHAIIAIRSSVCVSLCPSLYFTHNLLALCSSFDLNILNGACQGDKRGQYTYIFTSGNSVVDYFIFFRSLCTLPYKMLVLKRINPKHVTITCSVRCRKRLTCLVW